MNKFISISIAIALILILGAIFLAPPQSGTDTTEIQPGENIEIKDGVQYVTIVAAGGYSPRMTTAQANIPTKLVVKTDGTYDCSASLVIRSIGYQKILAQTGEEIIDLGTPQTNSTTLGTCGMGMYSFKVNFI